MNFLKDLDSLLKIMRSREEIIIFPNGAEGNQLLDFLRFTDWIKRVCCVASPQIGGFFDMAQQFVHEVPVIPFNNLVHFRKTAAFIVVVPEQNQNRLGSALERSGFEFVYFASRDFNQQVKDELKKFYDTGQTVLWYLKRLDNSLSELRAQINEANELTALHRETFEEYRNCFVNRDIVIVGTGPTLNYYKPTPNAIHIGLNYAWKKREIEFDYMFNTDSPIMWTGDFEEGLKRIRQQIFIARFALEYRGGRYLENSELVTKLDRKVRRYYLHDIFGKQQVIYPDIRFHTLMHFGSVVFDALHFALFTYPKRIFLVGCDTSREGHFYTEFPDDEEKSKNFKYFLQVALMKVGYARTKMFAKQYYPDTEIISVNPVGLRGLFKDVYTDEYLKALEEEKKASEKLKEG